MSALHARIAGYSTAQLHQLLRNLDQRPTLDEAERMVHAGLADELTRRWDVDAEVDAIFADLDFTGTYLEALEQAHAAKRATLEAQR